MARCVATRLSCVSEASQWLLTCVPLSQAAAEALSGCTDDSVKKTYLTTVKPEHAARVLGFMTSHDIALVLAPAPQSVRVPILVALSKDHPEAFQARNAPPFLSLRCQLKFVPLQDCLPRAPEK